MTSNQSPLRVLHIIVHLSAGGAELMMKRLVLSHQGTGRFEHKIISLRGLGSVGPSLKEAGISVKALNLNSSRDLPARFASLVREIRAFKPDLVQTWMYHADLFGGLAARIAGRAPIIWNVRIAEIAPEFGVSRVTGWIMKACAALSRKIPYKIVYVAESARIVHEAAGYDPSKSVIIRNGYAIPRLSDTGSVGDALCGALDLERDSVLIGSAGRFNAQKNHRSFVAACGRIAGTNPHAHFVMFGSGVDRENAQLSRWIEATEHADRFHLMGETVNFKEQLEGLNLFCLHSLSEGFPNVVAEAMAAAVPCVVTDVGDAAMLVDDTGWVVPPADDEALASAISAMLSLDDPSRRAYGTRARSRIESNFSMPFIAREYERLYHSASSHRSI